LLFTLKLPTKQPNPALGHYLPLDTTLAFFPLDNLSSRSLCLRSAYNGNIPSEHTEYQQLTIPTNGPSNKRVLVWVNQAIKNGLHFFRSYYFVKQENYPPG